jgi:adenosylhomocysteinase
VHYLALHAGSLSPGLQVLPRAIDERVARTKLESLGIAIDTLSVSQADFLTRWQAV